MANIAQVPGEPATQGTVADYPAFNAEADVEALRKAMKGLGTDESAITNVISHRSNAQRQVLKTEFKTNVGKDLVKELKSELGGHFEDTIVALMLPADHFDAHQLRNAISGLGTNENTLIEILCTRTNAQIKNIVAAYKFLFKKNLEEDLISDTSGSFRRILVSLVQGARHETDPVDSQQAAVDAKDLYEAGEVKWGTDESKFNKIMATRSFAQLRLTFDEYQKISKKSMEEAIKGEMSGSVQDAMLAIVKSARNRAGFFAERLYKSMKGVGTNDSTLIRIMVSRCEIDMVQIKEAFQSMYGKSLREFIADDCSGDYKKLLLQLCK